MLDKMGPIDYGLLAKGLLGYIQPVGDIIPFSRRNLGYLNLTEGAKPRYGGGTVTKMPGAKTPRDRQYIKPDISSDPSKVPAWEPKTNKEKYDLAKYWQDIARGRWQKPPE